jgi:hypothetical protein
VGERDLKTPLRTLQSLMTDAVLRPSPITENDELARRVALYVRPSESGIGAAERLDIYREQFWLRHLPNLRDDYPTLAWAVGPDAFERLSTQFLSAFPPRTWDLQRLGAELPSYVASHASWKHDVVACEAARLDWAFMEAYGAKDAAPFDPRTLLAATESAWTSARVSLHPSVRLLSLAHPVHRVRRTLQEGQAAEWPAAESTHLIVARDLQNVVRAAAVDAFAFALLRELDGGAPLGEACESLTRGESDDANAAAIGDRVAACFQAWTASGWVTAVTFTAPV